MTDLMPLIHRMAIGILVGIALARPLLEWFFRDGQDREWAAYAHSLLLQMDLGAPVVTIVLIASGTLLSPQAGLAFQPNLPIQLALFVMLLFTVGVLNSQALRQRQVLAQVLAETRLSTAQLHRLRALNRRQNVLIPVEIALILLVAIVSV